MHTDVNAVVGGYLRDMAFAQSLQQKMFGYKRAAAAILALDVPLTDLIGPDGTLPRIAGIGPGSTRIIREILDTGESPTVERAIDGSGRRTDIDRRRQLRRHFLSRAEARRVLLDDSLAGPALEQYRGDLQMHSEWSDGDPARQDLDHTLASRALEAGCVFALDSDAHATTQLSYAEIALAHARLAGISAERIVNCWPLDRLLAWLSNPASECRP
ncbi:MAG TPA: hypothetical protein VFO14_01270 [Vicinamibacterales bacterium]|nr:hypothetical protein [Vicinamibacterales bacterium]